MKTHEHRIKLLLAPDEFSQFFNYYSEERLIGSAVDLETDFESYFEGVGVEDLKGCFGAVADELCEELSLPCHPDVRSQQILDLVVA